MSQEEYSLCTILESNTEAQMLCDHLKANGVEAHFRGAKEYASIVTGIDQGRYEIMVPTTDLEKAKELMMKLQTQPERKLSSSSRRPPESYLKAAYLFALIGMFFIPLIFNMVSLFLLKGYAEVEPPSRRKSIYVAIGLGLNLLTCFVFYVIYFRGPL